MKKEKKLPNKKVRLLLKNKENRLVWVTVDVKITKEYENRMVFQYQNFHLHIRSLIKRVLEKFNHSVFSKNNL